MQQIDIFFQNKTRQPTRITTDIFSKIFLKNLNFEVFFLQQLSFQPILFLHLFAIFNGTQYLLKIKCSY